MNNLYYVVHYGFSQNHYVRHLVTASDADTAKAEALSALDMGYTIRRVELICTTTETIFKEI